MENRDSENRLRVESLRGEVHESRSRVVKGLLLVSGCVCVGLGVVGVVLPVVPTTPFLLLAAICFARSSERFYIWLLTNRYFGEYLRDWREKRGLTIGTKIWIIFVMLTTMGLSAFFVPLIPVRVLLAGVGFGVSAYIWRLPTKSSSRGKQREPGAAPEGEKASAKAVSGE